MTTATLLAIIYVLLFFVLVRRVFKGKKPEPEPDGAEMQPVAAE